VTGQRRGFGLLPPFLVGLVAALVLETSAGLLLYADEGLLPALTLILTIELGAMGLGLWSGSLPVGGGVVEKVRRRWLLSLFALALAAALAAGLSFMGRLPRTGLGQGVGLGFLGALPLFSIGSLLGALSGPDESGRRSLPSVGAPATLGAAVGFLLAGAILLPNTAPYTLYLFCLVTLSGGALVQGWVMDGNPSVEVLEILGGPTGELRAERRVTGSPRREVIVLLEGGRLRGAEDEEGRPARVWESAVLEGLGREVPWPESVLCLGGGSGTFARVLSKRSPQTRIHVLERSGELVTLARSRFAEWENWESVGLQIGEPLRAPLAPKGPFSLIVLDCGVLPTLGGAPFLEDSGWRLISEALLPGGVLAMGGFPRIQGDPPGPLREIVRAGLRWFDNAWLYFEDMSPSGPRLLWEEGEGAEALLLCSKAGGVARSPSLSGFQLQPAQDA
jgi:hypothetical protein